MYALFSPEFDVTLYNVNKSGKPIKILYLTNLACFSIKMFGKTITCLKPIL